MRRESKAAVKSGIISSLPLALLFVNQLFVLQSSIFLAISPIIVLVVVPILLVTVVLCFTSILGAVGGLVFVVTFNKLPFRSTYIKALLPFVILWVLDFLQRIWRASSPLGNNQVFFFGLVLIFDAAIFSYLFDRWRNGTMQDNSEPTKIDNQKERGEPTQT